jgi:uncharacterized membrane protein YfcA
MVHILPRAPVDYVLFMFWCFTVAVAGGLVGLVLGNIRLPFTLLLASSAAASIPGALIGARLTGRLSEIQLVRAIAGVLLVAGIATGVQAVA